MSLLSLAVVGVGLILLSLGIYFATRKLVMRSMFKGVSKEKPPVAEPLYETPMPKAPVLKAEEKVAAPEKNPLLAVIEEWEEPKPQPEPEAPAKKEAPKAEKPAPKTVEAAPEKVDNPLLKFIDEWEEPKAPPKKKK
jgi:outer membrane biosynthesis protein TonB